MKEEIKVSDRGSRPNQWSARKAQLLAQAYEKTEGGYKGAKTKGQKNLVTCTKEEWQTKTSEARAPKDGKTRRYCLERFSRA